MYLNVSENGALAFLDVTEQAGVCASGYGMGIAGWFDADNDGDLNNDGDTDIVVSNTRGPARLYRNESRGNHWLGVQLAAEPGLATAGSLVWLDNAPCQRRRQSRPTAATRLPIARGRCSVGAATVKRSM